MRLSLDLSGALIERVPTLAESAVREAGGRKHVELRQRFLGQKTIDLYLNTRPHNRTKDATSIPRDDLVKGLKASKTSYKGLVGLVAYFPSGNRGYSRDKRQTKAYRLRPDVLEQARPVFEGRTPLPVRCRDTGALIDPSQLKTANGIPVSLAHRLAVPAVFPLSSAQVDRVINVIDRWMLIHESEDAPLDQAKDGTTTLADAKRTLHVCRLWSLSIGGLVNFYQEHSTGRLGPSTSEHIVPLPSMLRRLLLAESALYDYDLKSCYWSLFVSLGEASGFSTERARMYLAAKEHWHERWMRLSGCNREHVIKGLALSWFTGGTLSRSEYTEAGSKIGAEGMGALADDHVTRLLYDEVREGMKALARRAERKDGAIVNAVGACLPLKEADASRMWCHLIVGYEQFVIRALCERVPNLTGIIYDGFVAGDTETEPLERFIEEHSREKLGVALKVTLKKIAFSDPIPDPERDEWDW